jgi:hypothetical protein
MEKYINHHNYSLTYFCYFLKNTLLSVYPPITSELNVTRLLEARILEPEETAVAMQRIRKPIPAVTSAHATIEELLVDSFDNKLISGH